MINVIGIGLEGSEGLTEITQKIVDNATVLVGSDRHLDYFPNHAAKKLSLSSFPEAISLIKKALTYSEKVVILVSGDPLFFGFGRLLLEHFPAESLCFHPHLSCVQLAFNRLKIPWQDAKMISVHGRKLDVLISVFQKGVDKLAILTDSINNPVAIARFYLSLDVASHYDIWIGENLGGLHEKVTHFSQEQLISLASLKAEDFASLNVVLFIRKTQHSQTLNLQKLPILGISDSNFLSFSDRPGLMTKRESRLLILGELSLQPKQAIWDIGSGTGSVAIEIARLCPNSQIFAVEKTAMGINLIQKNCQQFQVSNVVAIQANAPENLDNLPSPHRIFIGGSGGKISKILEFCQAKLLPDGKIVLATATLENLQEAVSWFTQNNWTYHLLQIQISRSVPIGDLTRFSPLNPVTLVTGFRSSLEV